VKCKTGRDEAALRGSADCDIADVKVVLASVNNYCQQFCGGPTRSRAMSVAVSQNVNSLRPVVVPCPWMSTAIMFHLPPASPPRIGSVNCGEKKELSVMKGWRRRRVGKAGFGTEGTDR